MSKIHPLPWGIYCHNESVGIGGLGGQGSLKESQTRTQLVSHFRLMTRMFVLAAAFHCAATLSETLAHRSDICTADSVQAGRNIY